MRLLILTQKIDFNDDILGFMHGWVVEFAKHFESIIVIALGVGEYKLPENVRILSLGKEKNSILPHTCHSREGRNPGSGSRVKPGMTNTAFIKIKYIFNFYKYAWQYRNEYDGVFIHMNQEYVILGGLLWRLLGKKVALWRNHQAGGFWVKLAVLFSHLVFCTSRFAFVARYKKNRIMPVGVNTDFFKPNPGTNKISRSTLFFSRISPIKRLDLLVDALNLLKRQNVDFTAKIVGDAPARDAAYLEENKRKVRDLELEDKVEFKKGEPNCQAPAVYQQSEVFINLTNSGSLDKTTMEAMACEQLVLVSNRVFENIFSNEQQKFLMFREGDADDLAKKIKGLFDLEDSFKKNMASQAREIVVSRHSLAILAVKLFEALSK